MQISDYYGSLSSFLDDTQDWELVVELKDRSSYLEVIQRSRQQPDIVVHFVSTGRFMLVELVVLYEP